MTQNCEMRDIKLSGERGLSTKITMIAVNSVFICLQG